MVPPHRPLFAAVAAAALLAACSDGDTLLIEPPPPSSLTVFPTAAPEGLPGELRTLSFKVALGSTQPRDVVVNWRTEAGTATPGEDYYDASGEAVIAAGELETAIEVELLGDALPEAAETFHLRVSTTANAAPTATRKAESSAVKRARLTRPLNEKTLTCRKEGGEHAELHRHPGMDDLLLQSVQNKKN